MKINKLVYKMLTESTGIAMMDSGGGEGRHWQQNQKKSLKDFENEPEVEFEYDSECPNYTISVFHYLTSKLELDDVCDSFNRLKCNEWDSDVYGISEKQKQWLLNKGFVIGDSWNTYNGESSLSQVLQGANVNRSENSSNFEYPEYVLIQIHQGCDVRGGYTDAKLFKMGDDSYLIEDVYGQITRKSGKTISIDNRWDGSNLTGEDGEKIKFHKSDTVELWLSN